MWEAGRLGLFAQLGKSSENKEVGTDQKSAMSLGGAMGAPMTAWQYDFNILPLGQQLWLRHLETYNKFPPLQAAGSYNLGQVLEEVKKSGSHKIQASDRDLGLTAVTL
jgi:hypothetical protein